MSERKALTKRTRFEVFKRDSFTCQYCGNKAPDVVLQVDHIIPVAKGGLNDILNLVTACEGCNSGKSDKSLSDSSAIEKQRRQLESLNERREQLEMMVEWQRGLLEIDQDANTAIAELWSEQTGYSLTESGFVSLRKLRRRFGVDELMKAIPIAVDGYIRRDKNGKAIHETVEWAFEKIGGICAVARAERDGDPIARAYYIRGILRNRQFFADGRVIQMIKDAVLDGVDIADIEEAAKTAKNWTAFKNFLTDSEVAD
jgi:hypothetical protein